MTRSNPYAVTALSSAIARLETNARVFITLHHVTTDPDGPPYWYAWANRETEWSGERTIANAESILSEWDCLDKLAHDLGVEFDRNRVEAAA